MRSESRPDEQVVMIARERVALKDCDVGEKEVAERPREDPREPLEVPLGDRADDERPFAYVLRASLAPRSAFELRPEDFGEVPED